MPRTFVLCFLLCLPAHAINSSSHGTGVTARGYSHGSVTPIDESIPLVAVSTTGSSALLSLAQVELERYAHATVATADGEAAAGPTLRLWVLDLSNLVDAEDATEQLQQCIGDTPAELRLRPQEHVVHRCVEPSSIGEVRFVLAGGDHIGALYAAYYFVEHVFGVAFSIAGDRLPSPRTLADILQHAQALDGIGTVVSPRFALRGIQPFHDFREGPDWWGEDDYAAIFSNMVKMRANFIGLHTYNFNELTNWIGPASAVLPNGSVTAATPGASFATSGGGTHFVGPKTAPFPTSSYYFGAAALFDTDCFCGNAEVVHGDACPVAATAESAAKAFDRAGRFQAKVFALARSLGVTTATGVELPVTVADSKYWPNETTADDIYTGVLRRLVNLQTPLDYFWLWSSEGWEWGQVNVTDPQVAEGLREFKALAGANRRLGSDAFKLASAGWTLGPLALDSYSQPDSGISPAQGGNSSTIPLAGDRLYWDKHLSDDYTALSSIDGHVGAFPPNPGFSHLNANRSGWAIPWLEDDPGITSIQFWAGRVLQHADKAAQYRAQGLFGIHWRTRSLSPQFSALFRAGWNDTALPSELTGIENEQKTTTDAATEFYTGWCAAEFGGVDGVPASVVSQACKPFRYLDAQVCSGNCANLKDYPRNCGDPGISRVYGTADCLRPVAWGSTMGTVAHKPGPTGQGSPVPDPAQCATLTARLYSFVDEFVKVEEQLRQCGKANAGVLERHQYWSDQFLAMRKTAEVDCAWANSTQTLATLRALLTSAASSSTSAKRRQHQENSKNTAGKRDEEVASAKAAYTYAHGHALPAYKALVTAVGDMFTSLLESVTNVGEMGVVGDLMDSKLPTILNYTDRLLLQSALELGVNNAVSTRALAEIQPTRAYLGRPRLFAPTLRSFADSWPLRIRAVLLSNQTTNATSVTIRWRAHADDAHLEWKSTAMHSLRASNGAGGVFEGEVGHGDAKVIEWTLSCAEFGLVFPATAPQVGHTVVLRSQHES